MPTNPVRRLLLAPLAATIALVHPATAFAADSAIVSLVRSNGTVTALVQTDSTATNESTTFVSNGGQRVDAQTEPLIGNGRPVLLALDAGGAASAKDVSSLQSAAADILLRIGTAAPITLVATGTTEGVVTPVTTSVADAVTAVGKVTAANPPTDFSHLVAAVESGMPVRPGVAVVLSTAPAAAPAGLDRLRKDLLGSGTVALVATVPKARAGWDALVRTTGGQVVAAAPTEWAHTSDTLSTTLVHSEEVTFHDPGASSSLSLSLGTGAVRRTMVLSSAPGPSPELTGHGGSTGNLPVLAGGAAVVLLFLLGALLVLRSRKKSSARSGAHSAHLPGPGFGDSRPQHRRLPRPGRTGLGKGAHLTPTRPATAPLAPPGPPVRGHGRPAHLHATIGRESSATRFVMDTRTSPSDRAIALSSPILEEPAELARQADAPMIRAARGATKYEPSGNLALPAVNPVDNPEGLVGEELQATLPGRESTGLIESADQWRAAGQNGDLVTLLDGLRWLQDNWPTPSDYEARLIAALRADLARAETDYRGAELSPDRGHDALAGVVEIADALWESRSFMPPAAARALQRATGVALARAEEGNLAPAFELLDLLLQHWTRLARDRDSNDDVRILLLDVAAFWSTSFDGARNEPDVEGIRVLIEQIDRLLITRSLVARENGEHLRSALTAAVATWRRRERRRAV